MTEDSIVWGAAGKRAREISPVCFLDSISVEEVGRVIGYNAGALPVHFGDIIAEVLRDLEQYCSVRVGYRLAAVTRTGNRSDGLEVGETFFSLQRIITAQLHLADTVALFAATIGSQLETMAADLFREGDPVKGHFVDTIASIAVERVADALHDTLAEEMCDAGLSVTNRFSPGYCGWPVSEQHALFSFFPAGFCGISVTESALMLPKKSVSGIIGIGSRVKREPYFCNRCTKKECTYRKFLSSRNIKDKER